jgi:DNA-binding transcriptional MerR regulator
MVTDKSIPDKMYFKISEVSKLTGLESYILRYWETEFKMIKPIRTKSNQRLYRKKDLGLILRIKRMLYEEGFTIAGTRKKLEEESTKDPEQLKLGIDEKRYLNLLIKVKKELKALREALS